MTFKTTKLSLISFWNVKSDFFSSFHLKIHWSCLKYAFMMLFNLRFEYMLTRFCVYLIRNSDAIGKIVLNKMVIWNRHSVNVIENVGIVFDMKWLYVCETVRQRCEKKKICARVDFRQNFWIDFELAVDLAHKQWTCWIN